MNGRDQGRITIEVAYAPEMGAADTADKSYATASNSKDAGYDAVININPSLGTEILAGLNIYAGAHYAESTDGVNWIKPNIGTITYEGSRENNLVFGLDASSGRDAHGATVFIDPSAPDNERYKLVSIGSYEGRFCVFGAVSPDGFKWKLIEKFSFSHT